MKEVDSRILEMAKEFTDATKKASIEHPGKLGYTFRELLETVGDQRAKQIIKEIVNGGELAEILTKTANAMHKGNPLAPAKVTVEQLVYLTRISQFDLTVIALPTTAIRLLKKFVGKK